MRRAAPLEVPGEAARSLLTETGTAGTGIALVRHIGFPTSRSPPDEDSLVFKHTATLAVLVFLAATWSTSPTAGHGAGYPPPPPPPPGGGDGGGSSGGTDDGGGGITGGGGGYTPPGGSGGGGIYGGPATPGPKPPSAPGPSGRGGARPTPGPHPPAAPKAGPSVPATPAARSADISTWDWWWVYNRDPYLDLKERVLAGAPVTTGDDFFLGNGTRSADETHAPSETTMNTKVAPALQRAIEEESSDRLLCDAMVALAKLHPGYVPVGGVTMAELFVRHLAHPNRKVVESAIVALGMMGDGASASILCDIAADDEAARRLLGCEQVPTHSRALAALAVGLVANRCGVEDVRRYVVFRLASIIERDKQASPDLFVGCITSIGLTPLAPLRGAIEAGMTLSPAASLEGEVLFLAELLADRGREQYVRAHVPKALGLLVRGTDGVAKEYATEVLLDVLLGRKKDKAPVRHGVTEALGLVGDSDADELDVRIREALRASARDGDAHQRQLSMISIALASSRPGAGTGSRFEGLTGERSYLLKQLAKGQSRLRPWAALALGLQAYHAQKNGEAVPAEILLALRESMADVGSPEDVGAWCIALGLSGDTEAVPELLKRLEDLNGDLPLGQVAISLGLLGDSAAIEPLRAMVEDATFRPDLLRESAIGLALLGDRQVTERLIEVLAAHDSMAIKSAATVALGYVADRRAVDPLVRLVSDPDQMEVTRAYAAIAVGIVCERDRLPWPALYSNHFNYEAATATLISGDGNGILNLR